MTHRYVDAGGLLTHVAEAGSGEPMVLLHGWPQNWHVWERVALALADHYHVICPDLRGHGWTEAPAHGYDKEQMATDVLALLDAMGLDSGVRLAGHDWGGLVGFLMCLRQPRRFAGYIAMNMIHPWLVPRNVGLDVWRSWYQALFASGAGELFLRLRPDLVKEAVRGALTNRGAMTDAQLEAYIGPLSLPARAAASVQVYRQLFLRDLPRIGFGRYRLLTLEVPTLLLFGADDRAMTARMLGGYEDHAVDMSVEIVPGAGHFIVDEMPDLVIDRLRDFFAV